MHSLIKHWIKFVILATGLALFSHSVHATNVIVHPTVQLDNLSPSNLRRIFTMRNRQWQKDLPIRVFVFASDNKIHSNFCLQTLEVFPYQLDKIWGKLLFSGLGEPPQVVNSYEEMIEKVRSTPGAIGYVDKIVNSEGLLIMTIGNNDE